MGQPEVQYYALMKDYVRENDAICKFCSRRLTSNTAYYLAPLGENAFSNLAFAGKVCFEKHAVNAHEAVPNMTTTVKKVKRVPLDTQKHAAQESKEQNVREYLFLRMGLMPKRGFKKLYYPMLYAFYKKVEAGEVLTLEENNKVYKMLIKFSGSANVLSLENLKICYALDYWLDILISEGINKSFAQSLCKHIHVRKYLTKAQIVGLNNTIQANDSIKTPLFDEELFAGVEQAQREYLSQKGKGSSNN